MDPNINVDCKITENRSAIPLFTIIITRMVVITEACSVIFRSVTEYGTIEEYSSSVTATN
ncbi:MAG: hypothetical protein K0Q94_6798 [Paenibacillus sp.]|nr:hypothetical protein [Paenibacillus sp.]